MGIGLESRICKMRALTYNAVITKSTDAIRTLFFPENRKRTSFDSFLKEDKLGKEFLVLSPKGGNGFLELDVHFPTSTDGKYVSLKMVDSSDASEFFALNRHPVDDLVLSRIEKQLELSTDTPYEAYRKLEGIGNKFYLAFGCGDNPNTWSGPYTMTLSDAKLNYDSVGVKVLDLLFTPNIESARNLGDSFLLDYGYGQKESRFDTKLLKFSEVRVEGNVGFNAGTGGKLPEKAYDEAPQPRWNYWVRAAIVKYLHNLFPTVPVGNILPLFSKNLDEQPKRGDANNEGKKAIINSFDIAQMLDHNKALKKLGLEVLKEEENQQTINISTPRGQAAPVASSTTTIVQNVTRNQTAEVRDLSVDPQSRSPAPGDSNYIQGVDESLKNGNYVTEEGGNLISIPVAEPAQTIRYDSPETRAEPAATPQQPATLQSSDGIPSDSEQRGARVTINPDAEQERRPAESKQYKLVMEWSSNLANSSDRMNSVLYPLLTFYKRLRDFRDRDYEFTIFEENDVRILRLLKENGIIASDRKPVILFGEKSLIKYLIYPKKALDANPKPSTDDLLLGSTLTFLREKNFKGYSEAYVDEFHRKRSRTSSFNEKINLSPYNTEFSNMLKDEDLVFMHNVKNSNVLDVSFSNEMVRANMLSIASESAIKSQAQAAAFGEVIENNKVQYSAVIDYIQDELQLAGPDNKKNITAELLTLLKEDQKLVNLVWEANEGQGKPNENLVQWIEVINFLVNEDEYTSPGPKFVVKPGERHKAYSDMLESLLKGTISVSIKTLPFFNHPQLFNRGCFLFGLENKIIGSKFSNKRNYSIFTGRYKILGVRHFMSSDDAFSNFELRRDDLVTTESETPTRHNITLGEFIIAPYTASPAGVQAARQRVELMQQTLLERFLNFIGF